MKILRQSAIIAAVCAVAELIKYLLPLPMPASVYGLILMLLALLTGLIKPEQISTVADFFISLCFFCCIFRGKRIHGFDLLGDRQLFIECESHGNLLCY